MKEIDFGILHKPLRIPEKQDVQNKRESFGRYYYDRKVRYYKPIIEWLDAHHEQVERTDVIVSWAFSGVMLIWLLSHINFWWLKI